MAHAKLSPSSSARWLTCPAAPLMEHGKHDSTSLYAAEGTAAHFLGECCLSSKRDAASYIGELIDVYANGDTHFHIENAATPPSRAKLEFQFDVDQSMADYVQSYVDLVRDIVQATGGELLIEQRLPLTPLTGELGATGTADAVILDDNEIIIVDLKYGQGLKVDAENNTQLLIYGLAAQEEYSLLGAYESVRLIISQPRLHHVSEWTADIDTLVSFAEQVGNTAALIHSLDDSSDLTGLLNPSSEACRYCKANSECKALAEHNIKMLSDDFESLEQNFTVSGAKYDSDTLAQLYGNLDLIKDWVKALEQSVYDKLMNGEPVGELKLVEGRGGARRWSDTTEAENTLKTMRIKVDDMYDKKVISPTSAEKLAKAGVIGATQWDKIQALIVRPDGKPSIAAGSDPRPALNLNPVEDFDDLTI